MHAGQQWNSLDTPDILCVLISKLPGNEGDDDLKISWKGTWTVRLY